MKIIELNAGLFPDAQTATAALRRVEPTHSVESTDVRRQDIENEAWGRVLNAILDSNLTITT